MMAQIMKKCPSCGSTNIMIDGVVQCKKGLGYYLSGAALTQMGERHGYKLRAKIKGITENAECLACHHKWTEK